MLTDPNELAAKAWEAIHRFDADAIPPGIRADEIAAIAAVYAPRLAELEAEVERLRDQLSDCRGCYWLGRVALKGKHPHLDAVWRGTVEIDDVTRAALGASHDA